MEASASAIRYRVTDIIASGGEATVCRAVDLVHGRVVALKFFHDKRGARREYENGRRVSHPNLPSYFALEEDLTCVTHVPAGATALDWSTVPEAGKARVLKEMHAYATAYDTFAHRRRSRPIREHVDMFQHAGRMYFHHHGKRVLTNTYEAALTFPRDHVVGDTYGEAPAYLVERMKTQVVFNHLLAREACVVMTFIDGVDAHTRMMEYEDNDYRCPRALVERVYHTMKDVLAYLHGEGYLHQDIKPENLMVEDTGKIWLVDLSTLKPCNHGVVEGLRGTRYCMPPEMVALQKSTVKSDYWQLGNLLAFLALGYPPFNFVVDWGKRGMFERIMYLLKRCDVKLHHEAVIDQELEYTLTYLSTIPEKRKRVDFLRTAFPTKKRAKKFLDQLLLELQFKRIQQQMPYKLPEDAAYPEGDPVRVCIESCLAWHPDARRIP